MYGYEAHGREYTGQDSFRGNFPKADIGDIITVHTKERGVCVKRVIAKEGDKLELLNGKIYKNGTLLSPYTCENTKNKTFNLSEGEYFIIGDNYKESIDSRNYGLINQEDIIGRVVLY